MGKLHISVNYLLGLLCAAALAFPSLASAGTVSVEVSPTTGYTSTTSKTFAPPARSSTSAIQTYKPTLGPLSGGGAYQTMQSGITITGIKQESQTLASTVSSRLRATAGAMKNGLGRCFTSFRCNAALMVGGAGIDALLENVGWIIDEGGQIRQVNKQVSGNFESSYDGPYEFFSNAIAGSGRPYDWQCPTTRNGVPVALAFCDISDIGYPIWSQCYFENSGRNLVGMNRHLCFYGSGLPLDPSFDGNFGNVSPPLSAPDIKSGIDSHYTPHHSDLPYLTSGGLDFSGDGVDIEIIDIPSVTGADSPNYVEYSDGTSKGTYSEYEFSWGAPSKQPEISVSEKTTETTYDETGAVSDVTVSGGTSSGSSANNPPEIPTDCDFMPTVCRFIDWFTEPDPELSQDPDFGQLIDDVDIERDFSVGSSMASCPAPFVIPLKWVPSVEVSLQPFCDFADLLRPVLLALAYLVSGAIILRT